MRKLFVTGLVTFLPVFVTLWIILFIVRLTTDPFQNIVESWLHTFGFFHQETAFRAGLEAQIVSCISTVIIIFFILTLIYLTGRIAEKLFFQSFLQACDRLLLKMPYVHQIYKSCKDVSNVLLSKNGVKLSQTVLVDFPYKEQKALGFATNRVTLPSENDKEFIAVVIPGTPNPTVGFLIFVPQECIQETEISTEEGLKWIISCSTSSSKIYN